MTEVIQFTLIEVRDAESHGLLKSQTVAVFKAKELIKYSGIGEALSDDHCDYFTVAADPDYQTQVNLDGTINQVRAGHVVVEPGQVVVIVSNEWDSVTHYRPSKTEYKVLNPIPLINAHADHLREMSECIIELMAQLPQGV